MKNKTLCGIKAREFKLMAKALCLAIDPKDLPHCRVAMVGKGASAFFLAHGKYRGVEIRRSFNTDCEFTFGEYSVRMGVTDFLRACDMINLAPDSSTVIFESEESEKGGIGVVKINPDSLGFVVPDIPSLPWDHGTLLNRPEVNVGAFERKDYFSLRAKDLDFIEKVANVFGGEKVAIREEKNFVVADSLVNKKVDSVACWRVSAVVGKML